MLNTKYFKVFKMILSPLHFSIWSFCPMYYIICPGTINDFMILSSIIQPSNWVRLPCSCVLNTSKTCHVRSLLQSRELDIYPLCLPMAWDVFLTDCQCYQYNIWHTKRKNKDGRKIKLHMQFTTASTVACISTNNFVYLPQMCVNT